MTQDVFFTSDLHVGHKNIMQLAGRPFADTEQMFEVIRDNWNSVVPPDGNVVVLGDVAMGQIAESLPRIKELRGYRILKLGNHDRPFMFRGKPREAEWWDKYLGVFDEVLPAEPQTTWLDGFGPVVISHFPATGDSHEGDRFTEWRPKDTGVPILHGHTHSTDRLTFTPNGTPQLHVGVDAWNFTPVPSSTLASMLLGLSSKS